MSGYPELLEECSTWGVVGKKLCIPIGCESGALAVVSRAIMEPDAGFGVRIVNRTLPHRLQVMR